MNKNLFFSTMFALAAATGLQAQTRVSTTAELEQALNTATSGVQIWVNAGIYQPSATLVVPAGVRLFGGFAESDTDPSQRDLSTNITILDGQNLFGVVRLGIGAELNGFTIRNGHAQAPNRNGGGVFAEGNTTIEHCIITNNRAELNGGGLFARERVTIINSSVQGNTAAHGDNTFGNCLVLASTGAGSCEGFIPPCDAPPAISTVTPTDDHSTTVDISFAPLTLSAVPPGAVIQWYSNTTASNVGGTYLGSDHGAKTPTFTPPSDVRNTAGVFYYAVVSNACGHTATANTSGKHVVAPRGCDFVAADRNLVTITSARFATAQEWSPGTSSLIWSDAVISDQCAPRGDAYGGGEDLGKVNVDCRNATHGFDGSYFSWCAVIKYADILCPPGDGWRVPTTEDFAELHQGLGFTLPFINGSVVHGNNNTYMTDEPTDPLSSTINRGGTWGGSRFTFTAEFSALNSPPLSVYWSSSDDGAAVGRALYYDHVYVWPQNTTHKVFGHALRCVRDN